MDKQDMSTTSVINNKYKLNNHPVEWFITSSP